MNYVTDMALLGAQVIAGLGFIGAGTIIVTKGKRVTGLTTAAGLWADGIVGLSLGAGFYEGAVLATAFILLAELLFSKLEYQIFKSTPEINLYIEYADKNCLDEILQLYKEENIKVLNMEITRFKGSENHNASTLFLLRLHKKCNAERLVSGINEISGIIFVKVL